MVAHLFSARVLFDFENNLVSSHLSSCLISFLRTVMSYFISFNNGLVSFQQQSCLFSTTVLSHLFSSTVLFLFENSHVLLHLIQQQSCLFSTTILSHLFSTTAVSCFEQRRGETLLTAFAAKYLKYGICLSASAECMYRRELQLYL